MRTSKNVIVVGGGIGGLTAALALRRDGHDVIVLERRPASKEAGAGISLWPNATRILRELGVGEALETAAISDGRATIRTPLGRRLSVTDMDEIRQRYAAPLAVVHRSHLLAVLRDAVGESALRLGVTCTGVVQDDRVACAQLADGSQVEGDVVVAADGVGSRLRDALIDKARSMPPDSSPGAQSCRRMTWTSRRSPARRGTRRAVRCRSADRRAALLVRLGPRPRVC